MAHFSKSVKSYADIHQAFVAAGAHGTVVLEFATHGEATVFGSRANAYRVLLRKQTEAAGGDHTSDFDHLMVCRTKGSNQIVIRPRGFNFTVRTPEGKVIPLDGTTLPNGSQTPFERLQAQREADAFLEEYENGEKK
jgi:hypothetical protein